MFSLLPITFLSEMIQKVILLDVHDLLENPLRFEIPHYNREFFPTAVHPAVQEEAVERFESEKLGFGIYQEPYFGG